MKEKSEQPKAKAKLTPEQKTAMLANMRDNIDAARMKKQTRSPMFDFKSGGKKYFVAFQHYTTYVQEPVATSMTKLGSTKSRVMPSSAKKTNSTATKAGRSPSPKPSSNWSCPKAFGRPVSGKLTLPFTGGSNESMEIATRLTLNCFHGVRRLVAKNVEVAMAELTFMVVDKIREKVEELNVLIAQATEEEISVKLLEIEVTTYGDVVVRRLYAVEARKVKIL